MRVWARYPIDHPNLSFHGQNVMRRASVIGGGRSHTLDGCGSKRGCDARLGWRSFGEKIDAIWRASWPLCSCGNGGICGGRDRHYDPEAIRLNNRGVAQMGQQFTDRAAGSFADAFKKDPKLAQAAINEGIALMALQKLDEAKRFCTRPSLSTPTIRRRGTTWAWRSTLTTNWMRRWPVSSRR